MARKSVRICFALSAMTLDGTPGGGLIVTIELAAGVPTSSGDQLVATW